MVNLRGSVGGKYGANTHLSTQRRRRILQAAQGLSTTGGGGGGRGTALTVLVGDERWEFGGDGNAVVGDDNWEEFGVGDDDDGGE